MVHTLNGLFELLRCLIHRIFVRYCILRRFIEIAVYRKFLYLIFTETFNAVKLIANSIYVFKTISKMLKETQSYIRDHRPIKVRRRDASELL